ncbi:transposase [Lactonifactor sp. BIOML-A4]|uniref:RNA-guided endonuclease InsQ/TnpB family protein n=1 Tax=unclassified Lactonifactor TaxID=2636670 RepID=UPI00325AD194
MKKIKAQRTERIVIKKSHPKFKVIDQQCFHSKNLYNEANYTIRQKFISDREYISYYDMNKEFKTHENYKLAFSQPANCTLRLLDKNWKSYFAAIKDWKKNPSKYLGMPKLPKYLDKDGRFPWMIPNNQLIYDYDKSTIYIRNRLVNDYDWKCRCLGRPIQVRFIPKGSCYVMEIIYEIEISEQNRESNNIAAIDLGVDNLVTMTNNIGLNPIIINGKGIKSINQFYNKQLAKEKSLLKIRHGKDWSKKLDSITFKRFQRIKNYMHNASHYIVKWCMDNNIDTLVIGKNKEWKQESGMSKGSNQKFISIHYQMLLQQLKYKCENVGINYTETEESYTSGTSFLDGEEPVKQNYDKNRRIERGLFKSNNGLLINSDVNGSLQIMKKVFPNAVDRYGIEGVLTPVVINVA